MQPPIIKYTNLLLKHRDAAHPEVKHFLRVNKGKIKQSDIEVLGKLLTLKQVKERSEALDYLRELELLLSDPTQTGGIPFGTGQAIDRLTAMIRDRVTELQGEVDLYSNKLRLKPYVHPGPGGWDNHNDQTGAAERIINLLNRLKDKEVIIGGGIHEEIDWAIGKVKGLVNATNKTTNQTEEKPFSNAVFGTAEEIREHITGDGYGGYDLAVTRKFIKNKKYEHFIDHLVHYLCQYDTENEDEAKFINCIMRDLERFPVMAKKLPQSPRGKSGQSGLGEVSAMSFSIKEIKELEGIVRLIDNRFQNMSVFLPMANEPIQSQACNLRDLIIRLKCFVEEAGKVVDRKHVTEQLHFDSLIKYINATKDILYQDKYFNSEVTKLLDMLFHGVTKMKRAHANEVESICRCDSYRSVMELLKNDPEAMQHIKIMLPLLKDTFPRMAPASRRFAEALRDDLKAMADHANEAEKTCHCDSAELPDCQRYIVPQEIYQAVADLEADALIRRMNFFKEKWPWTSKGRANDIMSTIEANIRALRDKIKEEYSVKD